ncbi:dispanin subfamily A member 2b-like [Glandiceps talaboti]
MEGHDEKSDLLKNELPPYTTSEVHVGDMPQPPELRAMPIGSIQSTIAEPPNDYMVWSILNCLCCCWILGLIAIFKSNEVKTALEKGDMHQAQEASQSAKGLNIAATIAGLVIIVIWIVVFATGFYKEIYNP